MLTRGKFLRLTAGAPLCSWSSQPTAPIRAITHEPDFHWFGYYDKLQFDATGRYVLGMASKFENRSPGPDDVIETGMIDTASDDRWVPLGTSRAWNWQQGCMLQWLPGVRDTVIWNDRDGEDFVARVMNVKTRRQHTLPGPVYAISPDGRWSVAPDFRRLADMRPGYGYAGVADPRRHEPAPRDAGIWRINLETGRRELLISIARVAAIASPHAPLGRSKHWVNHLLYSPDGRRFVFLHRWREIGLESGFTTRMFTADSGGGDLYVLDPYGQTSHFIWRDARHVLAWATHPSNAQGFYLYTDKTKLVRVVGRDMMTSNGHCSYLPGNRFILNDTYPDPERVQQVYLFDTRTERRILLGAFRSPAGYQGEWRCDTHPRFSRDGTRVSIDSPHGGNGRQIYLIDLTKM